MTKRQLLEVWKGQITGAEPNAKGVYLALLRNREGEYVWDFRYYAPDKDGKDIHPTRIGIMFDAPQRRALKAAMVKAELLEAEGR